MRRFVLMAAGALAAMSGAQLNPAWVATGNVEGQVFGDTDPAFLGNYSISVTGMPAGAVVQKAYLYANEWNNNTTATATFSGTGLGTIGPYTGDGGLSAFRWDVTALIVGNGAYTATVTGPLQNNGVALAIVYMEPSLPLAKVQINDGAWNLGDFGPEQRATTFAAFPGGPGTLSIYTQGDDSSASGEQVLFNGFYVGGPLDGNIGTHASIVTASVNVLSGVNTVAVSTGADQLGWQVAMLNNPVPEPGTLLVLALGGLWFARRRT